MMFFRWIFLSRRWQSDESRIADGMKRLSDPSRPHPMWLLIFPEGTNMSKRAMDVSVKWAEKTGLAPLDLTLMPRSRGLYACLTSLGDSVAWIYDCTIAYEGIQYVEFS